MDGRPIGRPLQGQTHSDYLYQRSVQNHLRPVSAWQIPHQLRQVYKEMVARGAPRRFTGDFSEP